MKKHFIYTIFLLCNFVIFIFNLQNLSAEENVENIYTQALQEIKNNDLLQAQILLNKVIKLDANHAGAKLDLAILQCKIGNKFQSEILLKELETKYILRQNIKSIIQQIRNSSCNENDANNNNKNIKNAFWLKLAVGYDTNINQGTTNPLFEASDGSQTIVFILADNFVKHGGVNFNVNVGFMHKISDRNDKIFVKLNTKNHNHYTYFNTATGQILYQMPEFYLGANDNIKITSNFAYNVINLDAKSYLSQQKFSLGLTPFYDNKNNNFQTTFGFNLTRNAYRNLKAYNAKVYELKTDLKYSQNNYLTTLTAGILFDKAENNRPGGNKKGFFIAANHKYSPHNKWLFEVFAHYQKWNSSRIYLANFIPRKRNQKLFAYGFTADYSVNKNNSFGIEFMNFNNQENISLFEYKNRSLQLYWQYYFEK